MAFSLKNSAVSLKPNLLIGENYQLSLKLTLEDLLAETKKETPNLSDFVDKFYYLMQAKLDPPMESIWVHSALSFRSHNLANEDPLNGLSILQDLFQFVSSCSSPCNSSKSIALLAPVILEVYKLVAEVLGKNSGSKREKKVYKKVLSIVEEIVGYISICCCKDSTKESEGNDINFVIRFDDLVSIWIDGNASSQSFLPLVSDDICRWISERGFDVNYLAGVVLMEAFLLKLCLDLRFGIERTVLEKELRSRAVASISSFHNLYFFEILVKMLLQPALPVSALLEPEDGVLLRNVLYDAVVLVEYSFLKLETVHLPAEHLKSIVIIRLVVAHKALELFRKTGENKRVLRYTNALANSHLPSQITKWISSLIGMDEKAGVSGFSSKALTKWLLDLEKEGTKVFNDSSLKCNAKLFVDDSDTINEQLASSTEEKKEDDSLFYLDDKEEGGKEDEDESMTPAFGAAAHSMRKRKGGNAEKRKIKYLKYDICSNFKSAASDEDSNRE